MAYIPSRRKRHDTFVKNVRLNLTSMMDMFTIILVFLLKAYTAEGQLIQPSETLSLPKSTILTPPEVALDLVVSKQVVMVNDKVVVDMDAVRKQRDFVIEPLKQELLRHATEAKKMEEELGTPFSGKVVIQGDKSIEYRNLVKIMATCGAADYPNMRLAVYRAE
ncbi:MAG: ExbD/TolR family protein [bacterium]